jgi:RNA polymerase sigma-70 factor (ECF subfamily)
MEPLGASRSTAAAEVAEAIVRGSYGRIVAYLASVTHDIADAEDAFSEALAAALRSWPEQGVPARPDSWLVTVARRNLIGTARRRGVAANALPMLERLTATGGDRTTAGDDGTIPDRRLQLLFACAHPAIEPTMRSPLMLQTVLGLDAAKIAQAFLVPPSTMGQRLVRVKTKIKGAGIPFAIPPAGELAGRLEAVLDAVYAAYGSGWDDPTDGDGKRVGLTAEAIRLARLITTLLPEQPEAHGLLALMLHSDARSAARRDRDGRFVALADQDVQRWSREAIDEAERHLATALALGTIGKYQLHGAVQSVHNLRAATGCTNWAAIAALYDGLVRYDPTVGAHVARAAAHAEAEGPRAGLDLLVAMPDRRVADYQPFHALKASCLQRLGRLDEAAVHARRAMALTHDPEVRRYLEERYATPSA